MRTILPVTVLCLLSGQASMAPAEDAKSTIAVMDFAPSNIPAGDAVIVSGFVRAAVVRSGKFTVVEKNNMDKVLAEQAFQQTGCTTSECAVKLGRLLNTRKMVIGEFALLGGVRFLTASLVDVETGQIEKTARVKGFEVATADEAADRLVSQLTGVAVAPGSERMGAAPPRQIEPYRPPRSHTRFGIGVSGEYFGYRYDMHTRPPAGNIEHAQISKRGGVMFTPSLRVPVYRGGAMTVGLDTGFGFRPGTFSRGRVVYTPMAGEGNPGNVLLFEAAALAVVGLTGELGVKLGVGILTAKYPAVSFFSSQDGIDGRQFDNGTLLGVVPATAASSIVLTGGLEWFMTRHDVLEVQGKLNVAGGEFESPSETNSYTIKYDSIRFVGGYKHYFGGGY